MANRNVKRLFIAFHMPAATGLIVQIVDRAQLQSLNALLVLSLRPKPQTPAPRASLLQGQRLRSSRIHRVGASGCGCGRLLYEVAGAQSTLLIAAATVILPTAAALCVRDGRTMTLE